MCNIFLEINADKLTLDNLKDCHLPVPVYKNETSAIVFYTEEAYCDYLNEIEKASTRFLAEYWMFKTPELIIKNRNIIRVLTILQEARAKKYL
ncbi:MAG: hypothetical protein EOP42_01420 [Sphingobacteriaceae bacterium]|nr:MAG: hypothetical protein EOP42_01420 [Sphingobacteriaceae bacterium]